MFKKNKICDKGFLCGGGFFIMTDVDARALAILLPKWDSLTEDEKQWLMKTYKTDNATIKRAMDILITKGERDRNMTILLFIFTGSLFAFVVSNERILLPFLIVFTLGLLGLLIVKIE